MIKKTICKRCGRNKNNSSDICFKCNYELERYMREHPIKDCRTREPEKDFEKLKEAEKKEET